MICRYLPPVGSFQGPRPGFLYGWQGLDYLSHASRGSREREGGIRRRWEPKPGSPAAGPDACPVPLNTRGLSKGHKGVSWNQSPKDTEEWLTCLKNLFPRGVSVCNGPVMAE